MTSSEIVSKLAHVLAGESQPDELMGIPVDSIPESYRPAFGAIVSDAQEHGTVDAHRILGKGNGEGEPLREVFLELLTQAEPAQEEDLVLDRGAPLQTARTFLGSRYTVDGVRALHYQGGAFYPFNGICHPEMDAESLKSEMYLFLEQARTWNKKEELVDFHPNRATVGEALDALKAITILPPSVTPPVWIDGPGAEPATEFIVCRNGLPHLPTGNLYPLTPTFYAHNALSFDFDPHAPRPAEWHNFLDSLLDDDLELRDTIQMMIGYFLTTDTRQQKIFLIVGPPRSGKGTLARTITQLVGAVNITAPSFAHLSGSFGLADLIGKQVAIVSDARIGKRTDESVIAERLLALSGEDTLTIGRKYASDWTGRLYTRFLILTNELPRITDPSGALTSRFIVINLTESFLGREDHALEDKIAQELPGILNWAIEGWRMLQEAGKFTQPTSALDAVRELEDLSSPIGAFILDECVVEKGAKVLISELFGAWKNWCFRHGNQEVGTPQLFGRDLRAARQGIKSGQRRTEGDPQRHRYYFGIRLKKDYEL